MRLCSRHAGTRPLSPVRQVAKRESEPQTAQQAHKSRKDLEAEQRGVKCLEVRPTANHLATSKYEGFELGDHDVRCDISVKA